MDAKLDSDGVAQLRPRKLAERLAADDPPVLVDVREPWEWEVCRLAGAIHMPLREFAQRFGEPNTSRQLEKCLTDLSGSVATPATAGDDRSVNLISREAARMDPTRRRSWLPAVVLVGTVYALVGIAFALPASHAHAWRLAAWGVSGAAYATHLGYERCRLRSSSLSAAVHVALAAALGALGLAVGAIVHARSVGTPGQHQRLLLVALAAWPVITGAPAFLVGLGASGLLARWPRRGCVESRGDMSPKRNAAADRSPQSLGGPESR